MNTNKPHGMVILIALLLSVFSGDLLASQDSVLRVYTFDMTEMIAPPAWRTTKKAFEQAEARNADLVLIHMNTYGGTLDDADSIRTRILNSSLPVYVWIDKNAASAGALIAISCDSIYMAPGSSIGAATVVNQSGEPLPDKYQSYMRSMMRATAEASHRNPEIAQAMVDPRLQVKGVSDSGQVLTFTVNEAIKHGYCEGEAHHIDEVLHMAGHQSYELIHHELSITDRMIGWLINPVISGILIMLIIGGIYFELQTPGIGFPLAAAFLAALLYFAPLYLEGMAANWEILLFILGVILIAIELFVIPGFGITGILGLVFMIAGLTLSLVGHAGSGVLGINLLQLSQALAIVITAFVLAIAGSIFLSQKLFTSHSFSFLSLARTQPISEGFTTASDDYKAMLGRRGTAFTMLRPAGKVMIDDELYDATARTGLIEKNREIVVTGYASAQLIVKEAD